MLFAFSVTPTESEDGSVAPAVAEAVRVVRESGLSHRTDAMFTTVEGEWDECMAVIKRASEAVTKNSSRVSLVIKADIRRGHSEQLEAKVDRVNDLLD